MFEKTKALCDSFLKMGVPGFDLMVYKDGQCVLRYMNGYADRENKISMKGNELYNIFSCSKPLTCVAAMQLCEKGMFRLEDKLSYYLPEYTHMNIQTAQGIRKAKRSIRIHNLFEMTAGFSYDIDTPSLNQLRIDSCGRCPTREVARALAEEPLKFEPGTRFLYSLGHDVLAALVEVVSGQPFAAYVKEHIFTPLGMSHSDFLLPMEDYKNIIPLYCCTQNGEIHLNPRGTTHVYRFGSDHASGGAGCVSTVEDYMKFLEALREGEKLLKRETVKLMTTQQLNCEQLESFTMTTYGYGLGLRVPLEGSECTDFGWGGAAGAYLAVDIPHNFCIFYAQHVLRSPVMALRPRIYTTVLEDLTGIHVVNQPEFKNNTTVPITY